MILSILKVLDLHLITHNLSLRYSSFFNSESSSTPPSFQPNSHNFLSPFPVRISFPFATFLLNIIHILASACSHLSPPVFYPSPLSVFVFTPFYSFSSISTRFCSFLVHFYLFYSSPLICILLHSSSSVSTHSYSIPLVFYSSLFIYIRFHSFSSVSTRFYLFLSIFHSSLFICIRSHPFSPILIHIYSLLPVLILFTRFLLVFIHRHSLSLILIHIYCLLQFYLFLFIFTCLHSPTFVFVLFFSILLTRFNLTHFQTCS